MKLAAALLCGIVAASVVACDSPEDQPMAAAQAWSPGQEWRLGEEPVLTIGEVDGPESIGRFAAPLAIGRGAVVLLSGGRIALADAAANEIRVYDRSGARVATMGGSGNGPGEFRRLAGIAGFAGGDSIAAWEERLRNVRVAIFSPDGALARTLVLGEIDEPTVVGLHEDGSIVVGVNQLGVLVRNRQSGDPPLPAGIGREPLTYQRFSPTGEPLNQFGPFPGFEYFITDRGEMEVVLLGRRTHLVTGRSRLFVGDDAAFEIASYAVADAGSSTLIRRPYVPIPAADSMIQRMRENRRTLLARMNAERGDLLSVDEVAARGSYPAFRALLEDADENLWVLHRYPDSPRDARIWSVFDPAGVWMGEVDVPAALYVLAIGDDEVLVSSQDDFGVWYVHLYPLLKVAKGRRVCQREWARGSPESAPSHRQSLRRSDQTHVPSPSSGI